jgi:hypothetical protein
MHSDTKINISNSQIKETSKLLASPTYSKVFVNDKEVELEAYNIKGNNYFKLRDIAMFISGTKKQFEVTWDENTRTIVMTTGINYTATGGELSLANTAKQYQCSLVEPNILLDGRKIELTAYTIHGYNYFKLRDVAEVIDFGVIWDGEANKINIDTDIAY